MEIFDYEKIEQKILNLPKFHKESNFETTKQVYQFLGKPGENIPIVHVAGTNGKGSVCAYMNAVLTKAGYKTGMFTSPHLVSLRERIQCNHELISEEDFAKMYGSLQEKIKAFTGENKKNVFQREHKTVKLREQEKKYVPVFYEVLFFMAMLYFEEKNVDVIILETGLGGKLDATNVIEACKVAVITEIGMDHMEILGDTYEKIAEEKAGIIKPGSYVVYSRNRQETAVIIERKARQQGVLCKSVEKASKVAYSFGDKKIAFSFFSRYYGCIPIRLHTCAAYQVENACLALTALEESGIKISQKAIQQGMWECRWEGRMEEFLPGVYIDGAHNEDGIDAFLESVSADHNTAKRWLLFATAADKEYEKINEKLIRSGYFSHMITVPLQNKRRIRKQDLEHIFEDQNVRISDDACEALQDILQLKKEGDKVYIVGSLYLAGEIKKWGQEKFRFDTIQDGGCNDKF